MSEHGIDLSCPICKEQYVALGITPEVAERAASEGPTCCEGGEGS